MFKKAVLKLTFLYSFLFFLLFWSFSAGLYAYLQRSFKQGYVTEVKERVRHESGGFQSFTEFSIEQSNTFLNKSAEVSLENLKKGLITVNMALFFIVPLVSWVLVKMTLSPLRDVMRKQKQFVSDASHELKTPLAVAVNEIEVTLTKEREVPYYVKTLGMLKEEIVRLSTLVNNLLMLAKHENNAKDLVTQKVEIVDLISKVVSSFSRRLEEKNIRYKVNFPEENIVVKGNATMLEQLFTNLLDNAFKFSSGNTMITINVRKNKHLAEIAVADEGAGISKEEQNKIFDRFYRVDASRSQTKGYGLGLSIASAIVILHGGNIHVVSETGKGSTFTVTLPVFSSSSHH